MDSFTGKTRLVILEIALAQAIRNSEVIDSMPKTHANAHKTEVLGTQDHQKDRDTRRTSRFTTHKTFISNQWT